MAKYLNENGLSLLWSKVKAMIEGKADKEFKTGSTSEYKVLSDNNLTDALVQKIKDAGSGTFTGSYDDLTEVPSEFTPSAHKHTASDVTDFDAFVDEKVKTVVGAAPDALNTLEKLSAALGNDASYAATITTQLALKANGADFETISNNNIDTICV